MAGERAPLSVIGGAVVSSGDLPSFPARIVDIIIYRGGDGSISTDKVDFPLLLLQFRLLIPGILFSGSRYLHMFGYRSFYLFDRESRYFIVSRSRSFLATLIQEVYEPYQCRA